MTEEIDDVEKWIQSLYEIDNEFIVEYAGKKLLFKKRFPAELAFKLRNKTEAEQACTMVAILSKKPTLTMSQAGQLPLELLTKIMLNLEIDPEILKKKLVLMPK